MKTAQTLKLWETPSYYMGEEFPDYYVIIGQNRDSKPLERANFDAMLELLGGESKYTNAVIVARASHWLVGWVETILVHKSASKKVMIADKITSDLQNYPVVDEDRLSQYETEEKQTTWEMMCLRYRMELCVRAGLSYLAARHEYMPGDVDMYLEV